jgi:acyl-CoA synthetase (AMP-forming)/AMP-acid ligase II
VPAPLPDPRRARRTVPRLQGIARDCQPEVVLTDGSVPEGALRRLIPQFAAATVFETPRLAGDADTWRPPTLKRRAIAVIQYTSGSTGTPRGVLVSHANFLHNLEMLRAFHGDPGHMVMVHWLPLFHDMGLIRGMMSPLHLGADCVMMPPMQFVQRPSRWLAAASRYRATSIGAPNFGYELCNRKILDSELDDFRLSTIRTAFCSAEPIRASTVEGFIRRFSRCGFERRAFRPSYGLAEATVMVSGEAGDRGPQIRYCDRRALRALRFVEVDARDADAVGVVCCGTTLGGQEIVTVDSEGRRTKPDGIGEIWVRGPSVANGYWAKDADTASVFLARSADGEGPYLRTGDLGWLSPAGHLFVTGRTKDVLVIRGQNYYPNDIEWAVEEAVPDVRRGCIAAFSIDRELGESAVIVCELAELAESEDSRWPALVGAIRSAIGDAFGLALAAVAFVKRGTIPKTASGKVQHGCAREEFLTQQLDTLHVWSAATPNERDERPPLVCDALSAIETPKRAIS